MVVTQQLYEQDPQNRTVDTLHELFRKAFVQGRPKYAADLFPTLEQQREFGLEGLRLLENYYKVQGTTMRHQRASVDLNQSC